MVFDIREMPKEWFKRRPERERGSHSREKITQLRLSMEEDGQLQPLGTLPDGTLAWGYGRHLAALESAKIQKLWTVVLDREISEEVFLALHLKENLLRSDLTDFEKAKGVQALRAANPELKAKDIAARLHVDPSLVTRWLSVFTCIPAVEEASEAGLIGVSKWYAISQLDPKEQHEALQRAANGETRDALDERGRRQRNGKKKPGRPKLARLNLKLGSVGVTVAAKELSLEGLIEWLGELRKRAVKAKEEGLSLKSFERVLKEKAKKGANHEPASA